MSYRLDRFEPDDGAGVVVLPAYNQTDDLSPALPLFQWIELPGGGAFDAWGSEVAPGGRQTLTKRATLAADSRAALQTGLDALKALSGKRGKVWARLYDGSRRWRTARCRLQGDWPSLQPLWVELDLAFECLDSTWRAETQSSSSPSLTTAPQTVNLTNNGNAPVRNAVITVPGQATAITAVTIGVSGVSEFTWTGSLGSGDELVIDCGAKSVKKNDADDFDGFSLTTNHVSAEWLTLVPGSTPVAVTIAPAGSLPASITVEWYDAWR